MQALHHVDATTWLSVQNRAFLSWVNYHLNPVGIQITDFTKDLRDGIKLIRLLERLSGVRFSKYNKNPRFPAQKLANISLALRFMTLHFGIRIIGCNQQDIMEGRRSQCMGLIFLLINKCKDLTSEPNASETVRNLTQAEIGGGFEDSYWMGRGRMKRSMSKSSQSMASKLAEIAKSEKADGQPDEVSEAQVPVTDEPDVQIMMHRLRSAFLSFSARHSYLSSLADSVKLKDRLDANPEEMTSMRLLQAHIRRHTALCLPLIRMKNRRDEIVREIASTEHTYVSSLETLVKVYMHRLESLGEDILPASKIRTIFSEIKVILSYNKVILNQIDERMATWYSSGQRLGDIFMHLTDFLKVYTVYVNNYDESIQALQDLASIPEAVAALAECGQDNRVRSMGLNSFLIMPIQRIPRYVMLLSDLFKHTPKTHPDYPDLDNARQKMENVATYVNQKKREAENRLSVGTVLNHLEIDDPKQYNLPHRHYVRQGLVNEVDANSQSKCVHQRYLFLFNDLLFVTKESTAIPKNRKNLATLDIEGLRNSDLHFKVLETVSLHDMVINDLPDVNKQTFMFEMVSSDERRILLSAPSQKLKEEWLQDLDDMVMNCLETRRSRIEYPSTLSLEVPADVNPTFSSTLYKRTSNGEWKKLFFALYDDVLNYYSDVLSSINNRNKPKGSLSVLHSSVNLLSVMDRAYCFQFCYKSKIYFLSAETSHARLQWLNCIRLSISRRLSKLEVAATKDPVAAAPIVTAAAAAAPTIESSLESDAKSSPKSAASTKPGVKASVGLFTYLTWSPTPAPAPVEPEPDTAGVFTYLTRPSTLITEPGPSPAAAIAPTPEPSEPPSDSIAVAEPEPAAADQALSPPESEAADQALSPPEFEAADQALSPPESEAADQALSPPESEAADQALSPPEFEAADQALSPPESEAADQVPPPSEPTSTNEDDVVQNQVAASSAEAAAPPPTEEVDAATPLRQAWVPGRLHRPTDLQTMASHIYDIPKNSPEVLSIIKPFMIKRKRRQHNTAADEVIRVGELYRLPVTGNKIMKLRVVLTNACVLYYKPNKKKLRGALDLLLVQVRPEDVAAKHLVDGVAYYEFMLVTSDKIFLLGSDNLTYANHWLRTIRGVIKGLSERYADASAEQLPDQLVV